VSVNFRLTSLKLLATYWNGYPRTVQVIERKNISLFTARQAVG